MLPQTGTTNDPINGKSISNTVHSQCRYTTPFDPHDTTKPLALHPQRRHLCSMANGQTTALERLLRPLSRDLTIELARALVDVQADAETQARYDDLADKHTGGQLSPDEHAELEST